MQSKIFALLFCSVLVQGLPALAQEGAPQRTILSFETRMSPAAVLWWNDEYQILTQAVSRSKGDSFLGAAERPKADTILSYMVFEQTATGFHPLSVERGELLTEKRVSHMQSSLVDHQKEVQKLVAATQVKQKLLRSLRNVISSRIPIADILLLRKERDDLDMQKKQVEAESAVVSESLKALDENRLEPEQFYLQERQLQQSNQEMRMRQYAAGAVSKQKK